MARLVYHTLNTFIPESDPSDKGLLPCTLSAAAFSSVTVARLVYHNLHTSTP